MADGLMTSTKVFEVAVKLASTADTFAELLVQLVELIAMQTHHNVVHCLRKLTRERQIMKMTEIINAVNPGENMHFIA